MVSDTILNSGAPHFYRFRSTTALLGEHAELENQQIYFAAPKDLNDPLEGFKNISWRGDITLWSNLLRHYLLCLLQTVMIATIAGPEYEFTEELGFVFSNEERLPTHKFKQIFRDACDALFAQADVAALPGLLASRCTAIKRYELTSYLRALHFKAINAVLVAMEGATLIPPRPEDDTIRKASVQPVKFREMIEGVDKQLSAHPEKQKHIEALMVAGELIAQQLDLINQYDGTSFKKGGAWKTIISDFPKRHVEQLEYLFYNDWYTACFVQEPMHSAMWGIYGDGHKGVCLKFRAQRTPDGIPALKLHRINGFRGGGGASEHIYQDVFHPFYKVEYQKTFVEIDFFRSLGRLSMPMLKHWYRDRDGNTSPMVADILSDSADWRDKYWKDFLKAITTKTPDWTHEGEYRLVLHGSLLDFSDKMTRKVRYDFQDLQGLIFGTKTASADKLKIIRIIEQKCRNVGRSDFEFLQAYYSAETGSMTVIPLNLVKFKGVT